MAPQAGSRACEEPNDLELTATHGVAHPAQAKVILKAMEELAYQGFDVETTTPADIVPGANITGSAPTTRPPIPRPPAPHMYTQLAHHPLQPQPQPQPQPRSTPRTPQQCGGNSNVFTRSGSGLGCT